MRVGGARAGKAATRAARQASGVAYFDALGNKLVRRIISLFGTFTKSLAAGSNSLRTTPPHFANAGYNWLKNSFPTRGVSAVREIDSLHVLG